MSVFAIARRGAKEVHNVVFSAGPDGSGDAVAVFSDEARAARYLFEAGWDESHTIAEIRGPDILQWLCALNRDGVDDLVVNPTRESRLEGGAPSVVDIRSELESAGQWLCDRLEQAGATGPTIPLQEIDLHHCQSCGKVIRVNAGEPVPICCGRPAEKAARDTVPQSAAKP